VIAGNGFASFYNGQEAILLIDKITEKCQGKYICKATNNAGTATSTCVITVVESSTKSVDIPKETSKPAFYIPLKNKVRILPWSFSFLSLIITFCPF